MAMSKTPFTHQREALSMKLKEIYNLAISLGKEYDVRGEELGRLLEELNDEYEKNKETHRDNFDLETLHNPYSDTRILYGAADVEVQAILCGIDMETPELLMADRLREKGRRIDLVLAHHPEGIAQAGLHGVMAVQADMLEQVGVPINIGEGIMTERIAEVRRGMMPFNHQRAVDAARLLDIPFMCVHSPADNLVNHYLQKLFAENSYRTLQDVLDLLLGIPEYKKAQELKAGPHLLLGERKKRAGKIFIKMTGGTGGSEKAYEKLAAAGVGTVIAMHMQDKHRKAAKEHNINVIISGHMASDSLGVNLFLDQIEKQGVEIIPCSGLLRVSRN